jgi:hypothetical protein
VDLGDALAELRRGCRLRRRSWSEGTFIVLVKGVMIVPDSTSHVRKFLPPAVDMKCGAHVLLYSAQGVWEPGWAPTHPDLFAEDWEIVTEPS